MRPPFFEKSNSTFSWPICLYSVLLGVGLLPHLLAAVAEDVPANRPALCFFQPPDLGRVERRHLRDLGGVLCALIGFDSDPGLQAGW